MDRNIIPLLLSEGYSLGRIHHQGSAEARAIPKEVVVTSSRDGQMEYCATSTRIVLIGREISGGPLKENYGVVCGEDLRSSTFANTLGGGRLEPYAADYRAQGDTTAEESVIECLLREVDEELGIQLKEDEVTLIGLRTITEDRSDVLKTIDGRVCVDAYFCGFVDERLGAYRARNGETGDRRVLSPEELLAMAPRGSEGEKTLPQTQRLAVATAIITIADLWMDVLPAEIRELISRTLPLARTTYRNSSWTKNFVPLIQKK